MNTLKAPSTGAKLFNKRRIITILILLTLSLCYLFWQEAPVLKIHNNSTKTLAFTVQLNNNELAKGEIPPNTQYNINLPFFAGRNASIYFQAKTVGKVISSTARTSTLGGIDFYITPDLAISMDQTPPGFILEESEEESITVK